MAKITLKELMDHKEKLKTKRQKTATIYVESLNGEVVIQMPTKSIITESLEISQDDAARGDAYMVLQCIKEPNIKDKGFQESFECVEPLDVVDKVFLPGEVSGIAAEAMKLAGYYGSVSKVEEDIKN